MKDLGGTLMRNIQEVEVNALPQNLPHEITVDISGLATFEDKIAIKDLQLPGEAEILRDPEDTVTQVTAAQDVEKELEQPVEENVEAVEATSEAKEKEGASAGGEEKTE